MPFRKKWFSGLVFLIGCLISLFYLMACATPYISPEQNKYAVLLELSFPILFMVMVGWCCISLIFYRNRSLIFLLCLAAGYQNIQSVFGMNRAKPFVHQRSEGSIRILSWNVNNFSSVAQSLDSARFEALLGFIKSTGPDIICFQDFNTWHWSNLDLSMANLKKYSGLTHVYFCDSVLNDGVVIFSRWPILQQSNSSFGIPGSTDCLQWVDLATPFKTLRVYNTHLTSMNIHAPVTSHQSNPRFKFIDYDTAILLHSSKLRKLAYFDRIHQQQAELVKKSMDSCKGPFIFTADLNAVPSSYVYHHIRKGLKDAFLETGFGMGRTYDSLSPTLRIDVLLMSPSVNAVQYHSPNLHLSDHYPIIADISIKP